MIKELVVLDCLEQAGVV